MLLVISYREEEVTKLEEVIRINRLSIKDSKEKLLVDDLSFVVKEGDSVGIVGESGSGKSLTMKTLLGLLPEGLSATFNKVELFGSNPYALTDKNRRQLLGRKVGYIPQNTSEYLHPLIKIKNQIGDGYKKYSGGNKNSMYERALDLLEKVGLVDASKVMDSHPHELSGGMRQRVNIAMAMMNNPGLLIADEPTTALDVEVAYNVMELLSQIHQETNNTMLIISHDLSLIRRYTDYVVVMYNGVVQEMGRTEDIFNDPQAAYTKALLSVALTLDQDRDEKLRDISYYLGKEIVL